MTAPYRAPGAVSKPPPLVEWHRAIAAIGSFIIDTFEWDTQGGLPKLIRITAEGSPLVVTVRGDIGAAGLTVISRRAGTIIAVQRDKDGDVIEAIGVPGRATGRAIMNATLRVLASPPGSGPQRVTEIIDDDHVRTADGRLWRMQRTCPAGRWCYRVGDPTNARTRMRTGEWWPHPFKSDFLGTGLGLPEWCIVDVADDTEYG